MGLQQDIIKAREVRLENNLDLTYLLEIMEDREGIVAVCKLLKDEFFKDYNITPYMCLFMCLDWLKVEDNVTSQHEISKSEFLSLIEANLTTTIVNTPEASNNSISRAEVAFILLDYFQFNEQTYEKWVEKTDLPKFAETYFDISELKVVDAEVEKEELEQYIYGVYRFDSPIAVNILSNYLTLLEDELMTEEMLHSDFREDFLHKETFGDVCEILMNVILKIYWG